MVIAFSAGAAGALYLVQDLWLDEIVDSRPGSAIVRALRMILVYILPALWYLRRHGEGRTAERLGLILPRGRVTLIMASGLGLYTIALAVFMLWPPPSCGFRFWETGVCTDTMVSDWMVTLPVICIMAMITDLWTRGFVLLQAAERWGEPTAIILQNILWLLLHLYELELLAPTMGWTGAVLLALFLGIVGDMIVLRERSVIGLMAGHALLNIGWAVSLATWFSP